MSHVLDELAPPPARAGAENGPRRPEHYGRDWTRRWTPAPLAIALPASIEEVQGIVRWANANEIALVPSGGRTGLSGGAVAAQGELVVSTERMNKVLNFDRDPTEPSPCNPASPSRYCTTRRANMG
jgi:FAD/FMN-containing dehydrogenase